MTPSDMVLNIKFLENPVQNVLVGVRHISILIPISKKTHYISVTTNCRLVIIRKAMTSYRRERGREEFRINNSHASN